MLNAVAACNPLDIAGVAEQTSRWMKTRRTFLQWAGHLTGALLFTGVAFVPTGIYTAVWWFIPKTFWPILLAVLGGIVWLVVQVTWALYVGMEWDDLHQDAMPTAASVDNDGDLDISF